MGRSPRYRRTAAAQDHPDIQDDYAAAPPQLERTGPEHPGPEIDSTDSAAYAYLARYDVAADAARERERDAAAIERERIQSESARAGGYAGGAVAATKAGLTSAGAIAHRGGRRARLDVSPTALRDRAARLSVLAADHLLARLDAGELKDRDAAVLYGIASDKVIAFDRWSTGQGLGGSLNDVLQSLLGAISAAGHKATFSFTVERAEHQVIDVEPIPAKPAEALGITPTSSSES